MKTLLVLGATSRISRAVACLAAREGWTIVLGGHHPESLEKAGQDIKIRSNSNRLSTFLLDLSQIADLQTRIANDIPATSIDGVFITTGIMPPEAELSSNPGLFARMADINYSSTACFIDQILPRMKSGGFVSCVTSVAGDRGRPSNFRYGSTKAALSTYLEGLSVEHRRTLLIQDVKLGPVLTPMNAGVTRTPFMISPEEAAAQIWSGIKKRRAKIYVPAKWAVIMLVIRMIPRWTYQLLKL